MTQKPETVGEIIHREWKMPLLPLHAEFKLNRATRSGIFAVYVTHRDWTMRVLAWPIAFTPVLKEQQDAKGH